MKKLAVLFVFSFILMNQILFGQDSLKAVEPEMETSYENYEVLFMALLGLFILAIVYFFYKRSRRQP